MNNFKNNPYNRNIKCLVMVRVRQKFDRWNILTYVVTSETIVKSSLINEMISLINFELNPCQSLPFSDDFCIK